MSILSGQVKLWETFPKNCNTRERQRDRGKGKGREEVRGEEVRGEGEGEGRGKGEGRKGGREGGREERGRSSSVVTHLVCSSRICSLILAVSSRYCLM